MKLPWDKKYLKISFHVVITAILIYLSLSILSLVFTGIFNINDVFVSIGSFFGYLTMILKPLIIAFIIAYIMDPIVDKFQKLYDNYSKNHMSHDKQVKIMVKEFKREEEQREDSVDKKSGFIYRPRSEGTLFTYLVFFATIGLIIALIVTSVTSKSEELISDANQSQEISEELNIDNLEDTTLIEDIAISIYAMFDKYMDDFKIMEKTIDNLGLSEKFDGYIEKFGEFIKDLSTIILKIVLSIASGLATFFISLVLAFYMLRDKAKFKHNTIIFLDMFTPKKLGVALKNFGGDLHAVFSGYLRGQLTDAAIIGFLLGASLSVIGIPFAWFIGIFSGFSNLIPYIGAFVGFILAVTSGLLSGQPILALYATIIIIIIQQLDTIYISPKFVGQSVELSPFLVILSLAVAGSMFGLVGMILAVPVTAIIKILISRFVARNKDGSLFTNVFNKIKNIGR